MIVLRDVIVEIIQKSPVGIELLGFYYISLKFQITCIINHDSSPYIHLIHITVSFVSYQVVHRVMKLLAFNNGQINPCQSDNDQKKCEVGDRSTY